MERNVARIEGNSLSSDKGPLSAGHTLNLRLIRLNFSTPDMVKSKGANSKRAKFADFLTTADGQGKLCNSKFYGKNLSKKKKQSFLKGDL